MRRSRTGRYKEKKNTRKRNSGVLRRVLFLLIGLVVGVNLYLWNARSLVGNQLPMPLGFGMAVVLSGSMEPVLSVDDLVFIEETQDAEVGDIIVYQSENALIIHRVIAVEGGRIQTQGDANNAADSPVDLSAVKGKMIGSVPGVGGIVRVLRTPGGVLAVIAAAFILMELSYRSERRRDDEEIEEIKEEIRRLKGE